MTRFGHVTLGGGVRLRRAWGALFLAGPPAVAQGRAKASTPIEQGVATKAHHLVLQVKTSESATMNLALTNGDRPRATLQGPRRDGGDRGLAFGLGLHMPRDDPRR